MNNVEKIVRHHLGKARTELVFEKAKRHEVAQQLLEHDKNLEAISAIIADIEEFLAEPAPAVKGWIDRIAKAETSQR